MYARRVVVLLFSFWLIQGKEIIVQAVPADADCAYWLPFSDGSVRNGNRLSIDHHDLWMIGTRSSAG